MDKAKIVEQQEFSGVYETGVWGYHFTPAAYEATRKAIEQMTSLLENIAVVEPGKMYPAIIVDENGSHQVRSTALERARDLADSWAASPDAVDVMDMFGLGDDTNE